MAAEKGGHATKLQISSFQSHMSEADILAGGQSRPRVAIGCECATPVGIHVLRRAVSVTPASRVCDTSHSKHAQENCRHVTTGKAQV